MSKSEAPKSGLRKKFEILSTPALLKLNSIPRWIVPLLMAAFLLVGLFVPGVVGGTSILIVGLFVSWLFYLSWPLLDVKARLFRLIMVGIIFASALTQILVLP